MYIYTFVRHERTRVTLYATSTAEAGRIKKARERKSDPQLSCFDRHHLYPWQPASRPAAGRTTNNNNSGHRRCREKVFIRLPSWSKAKLYCCPFAHTNSLIDLRNNIRALSLTELLSYKTYT